MQYLLKIQPLKSHKKLNRYIESIQKELNSFFRIKIERPLIFLVGSRREIDILWNKKTQGWLTAWMKGNNIFILHPDVYTKESDHKDIEHFWKTLKHEYCHIYFKHITGNSIPKWLNEGLACYLAKQEKKVPSKDNLLKVFNYFRKTDWQIYSIAYFWTKFLIENYGLKKLLELINQINPKITQKQFSENFYQIYRFHYSKKDFGKFI